MCGLRSNLRQISPIVVFDSPVRSAIFARVQWVAFGGVDSNVATITSSTWSMLIVGGRPDLGSSSNPSSRSSRNRLRHFPTVIRLQARRWATWVLSSPSALASTIFARNANDWADDARRAHRANCSRSSAERSSSDFGRP